MLPGACSKTLAGGRGSSLGKDSLRSPARSILSMCRPHWAGKPEGAGLKAAELEGAVTIFRSEAAPAEVRLGPIRSAGPRLWGRAMVGTAGGLSRGSGMWGGGWMFPPPNGAEDLGRMLPPALLCLLPSLRCLGGCRFAAVQGDSEFIFSDSISWPFLRCGQEGGKELSEGLELGLYCTFIRRLEHPCHSSDESVGSVRCRLRRSHRNSRRGDDDGDHGDLEMAEAWHHESQAVSIPTAHSKPTEEAELSAPYRRGGCYGKRLHNVLYQRLQVRPPRLPKCSGVRSGSFSIASLLLASVGTGAGRDAGCERWAEGLCELT